MFLSKRLRVFYVIFALALAGSQFLSPLGAQAAPAPDPQPAPLMVTVPAEINKSFTPISIVSGATSKLRVTVYNLNANPLTSASWTDNMPAGITVADPLNVTHTCGAGASVTDGAGGTLDVGDTSFMLNNGTVPGQSGGLPGSCYVEVDVTSYTPGNLINTIPAGNLSSETVDPDGNTTVPISNTTPASATLNVIGVENPSLSKAFAPNTIFVGDTANLSITIHNNDLTSPLTHLTVTDILPTNGDGDIELAPPLNYSLSGCGTGATLTDSSGGALAPGSTSVKLNDGEIAPDSDCVISVDVTSLVQGNYTNTIPAGPTDPNSIHTQEGATNEDPANAPLNVQAFTIDKSFATSPIAAGQTSEVTITIENHAPFDYTGATLDDVLPAGLEFLSSPVPSTTNCTGALSVVTTSNADDTLRLTGGTLPANSVCTINATARALMSTPVGTYTNTIDAGDLGTTQGATNHSPTSDSVVVQSLSIDKDFAETEIPLGGTSLLTIKVFNPSPSPFTNTSLDDVLPTGLEYVAGTGSTTCGSGSVSLTSTTMSLTGATIPSGSIASPGTCEVTATVQADPASPPANHTNTIPAGEITTDEGGTNASPASDSINVTGIEIAKSFSPSTFAAGAETTLTITITNPATIPFTGASLSDTLPTAPNDELYFTGTPTTTCTSGSESVTLSGSPTTRTVTLTDGTIPASGSCTITATVTTDPDAPATSYLGANRNIIPANSLTTNEGASNSEPARAPLHVETVSIDKNYDVNSISYPDVATLTITITNPATASALTGLHFTDTLPSGLVIASAPAASTTCNSTTTPTLNAVAGTDTISLSDGSIGAGFDTCNIIVPVTAERTAESGSYTNTIGAGGLTSTEGPTNTFGTSETLDVEAVSISKAFQYAGFQAGTTNTLTITLNNPTGADYVNAAVSDTLPTSPNDALYFTGTPTTTCTSGTVSLSGSPLRTVSLSGATIPANGNCTITVNVTTNATATDASYTNRIPVGALTTEITPGNQGPANAEAATAPVFVYTDKQGVTANKSFTPSTIDIFGNSRLRITFEAPPDTNLTSFQFTDNLPAGVTVSNSTNPSASNCGAWDSSNAWWPANDATSISATGGTILAGQTCTVDVYVTSDEGTTPGNVFTNTITPAQIDNTEDRHPPSDVTADLTVRTPSTLLTAKEFSPTVVGPGGRSTLTITLENESTTTLTNVQLDDILPGTTTDGLVIANPNNASTTCGGGTITAAPGTQTIQMTGGTVPAQVGGVNGICTIIVNVEGKSSDGTIPATHTNTIPVDQVVATFGTTPSTMNPQNAATDDLTVKDLDLEIVKGFAPQLVYGGADSVMSIVLRNPNNDTPLTDIAFTDNMWLTDQDTTAYPGYPGAVTRTDYPDTAYPEGEMILIDPPQFDASDCGPSATLTKISDSVFEFSGGYLAPGDECTLTLRASMTVNGNRTNTIPAGAVTTFNGATNGTPTSATLTNLASASVSKSFSPNPIAAGLGSYSILTIEIRTTATVSITGLGLTDNLPAGLEVADWNAGGVAAGDPPHDVDTGSTSNICNGGTLTANPGGTTIQLSGAALPIGYSDCSFTIPVTGAEPGEYDNIIPQGGLDDDQDIRNIQPTEDTLTLLPYSLGNRVWFDTNNNGSVDTGEVGVSGVRVELYNDTNNDGVYDTGDTFVKFDTTDADGYYRFDDLGEGHFIVVIPGDNFRDVGGGDTVAGNPLEGYVSSGTNIDASGSISDSIETDPDNDADNDDNGVTQPNAGGDAPDYVWAKAVDLGPEYSEPLNELDPSTNPETGEANDNQSNRTVDFGFYKQELGNLVFLDEDIDGVFDAGEAPIQGAIVRLFSSDGTEILTGADGVWGTEDDGWGPNGTSGNADDGTGGMPTDASGNYLFSGLPEGNYIVKVDLPGYRSTVDDGNNTPADVTDPDANIDDNDNGLGQGEGTVAVGDSVTLTPGSVGAAGNNIVTNNTGTTHNPTVDFGYVLPRSIGNRLWFDDGGTTGTINNGIMDGDEAPVVGARVSLYEDSDSNGVPDGAAVAWDVTDTGGYYLFDGLFPGNYLIGVDYTNFETGSVLEAYTSSTGNASNDDDLNDNGIDRIQPGDATASPYGILSNTLDLTAVTPSAPTGETDLSGDNGGGNYNNNPTNWDGSNSRGRYGESDTQSDLTIDFGFFKPMSIGNRVFYDNGSGADFNNGVMDAGETPVSGVRVELYQDTDGTPGLQPATDTLIYFDTTDTNGYYLFDQLPEGEYYVHIPSSNFTGTGALRGWYNSDPTFADNVDSNDNGINIKHPDVNGVTSNLLTLTEDNEPTVEIDLSGETDPGAPANTANNPTGWDGDSDASTPGVQGSRGRFGESDNNSDLTIDFGFIPPLSLGNRVWIDDGADSSAATGFVLSRFNNGIMDGIEVGRANVTLNLYYDADDDGVYTHIVDGVDESAPYRTTTTDADGFYLFDGLPEGRFFVEVAAANFAGGNALEGYQSSDDTITPIVETSTDVNDNGNDDASYLTNGIDSNDFVLDYGLEPTAEADLPANTAANRTAYGNDLRGRFGEEDNSSNLTLDFGFVKPHSIGNRVWRDSDNSGTINAPDNVNPGIGSVHVNLYYDVNNDGTPDDLNGDAIFNPDVDFLKFTTTDADGYYLFGNLPAGNYIVGIPDSNFNTGQPLDNLRSSTGTPASATYETPGDSNPDSSDHGIDPASQGDAVFSPTIPLGDNEPTSEADLPSDTVTYGPNLRGVNGETDNHSDLTVDFGFFGGTDVPFSIGNHLWYDDGTGGGNINNGIRDGGEQPVAGARVELYRDGDGDGPEPAEMIRFDVTDAGGFYLFDNLDPGDYYVWVAAGNFTDSFDPDGSGSAYSAAPGVLRGWHSSQNTWEENTFPVSTPHTPAMDSDDNGVNNNQPDINGIYSGVVVLARGSNEPSNETHLSSDSSTAAGFNPTAGDGDGSLNGGDAHIGRFGETDLTSNLTIDFGFIPPMSLGNRVWIDDGAGEASFGTGYNNGAMDGTEAGVSGVVVDLYKGGTLLYSTTTDADGYYLFERLQPASDYAVRIAPSNFASGGALEHYLSSTDANHTTPPADDSEDIDDNGEDDANYLTNGIYSSTITMSYDNEPLTPANETDINNTGTYGPNNVGNYGQDDDDSNLTMDFGFFRPRSLGNRVWFDTNNNGEMDAGETPIENVRVSLYLDANTDGIPDDLSGDTVFDHNDAIRYDITDANGYYLFDNLPPYNYIIGVDSSNFQGTGPLVGYYNSTSNRDNPQNNDDYRDNGLDRVHPEDPTLSPHGILSLSVDMTGASPTGEAQLSSDTGSTAGDSPTADDGPNSRGRYGETDASSNLTMDFGFYKTEIGNLVYFDENANGTFDGSDTPINNVVVQLFASDGITEIEVGPDGILNTADDATGGVTTGSNSWANGEYLFSGLPEGDYIVRVTTPPDRVSTIDSYDTAAPDDNVNPNDHLDNNDNGQGVGLSTRINVSSAVLTMDAGVTDGSVTATFSTGITRDNGLDFGFTYAYALGNRVWFDTDNGATINNGEGLNGATKVGVDGVRVELYAADTSGNPTGSLLEYTTTANGGYYLFNYLTAGDYVVVLPEDNFRTVASDQVPLNPLAGYWSSTTQMQANGTLTENVAPDPDLGSDGVAGGTDDDTDSDDNGTLETTSGATFESAVLSKAVTLGTAVDSEPTNDDDLDATLTDPDKQGQIDARANMTVDFGFYKTEIGNFVFEDRDRNGIFDGSDTPISGVTMRLFTENGTEIAVGVDGIYGTVDDTTGNVLTDVQTDGSGLYSFSGLPAGNYIVKATTPAGFASTTDADSNTPADVSNPDTNIDNNDNGVGTDDGDANRLVSANTLTMNPGDDAAKPNRTVTYLTGTTTDPTVDFGFHAVVSIGSTVFADHNNNGLQDAGDSGISGVGVQLYLSTQTPGTDTPIATDTTDTNGDYYFNNLEPNSYIVYIPTPPTSAPQSSTPTDINDNQEDGDDNGSQTASGAPVTSPTITLTVGAEPLDANETYQGGTQDNADADANGDMTVDFGFFPLASQVSLGSTVFADTNDNGVQDAGELGISGVDVQLYLSTQTPGTDTPIATDTTDTNGDYFFGDLPAGDYIVYIPTPPAYAPRSSTPTDIADNQEDGDDNGTQSASGAPVTSPVINLTVDGEPTEANTYQGYDQDNGDDNNGDMTVDFGFIPTVSIGSYVWLDADRDGIQDAGELGVNGAVVTLLVDNGSGFVQATDTNGAVVSPVTTGANGLYHFTLLPEGDYRVRVTPPAGYTPTPTQVGTDNDDSENDSNINLAATGLPAGVYESGTFTLSVGGEPNETGTFDGDIQDDSNELNGNMTVDFGFNPYLLTVTKDDGYTVVSPGTELTYTITVTNTGGEDLTNLTVTDTLPAEVNFVSASNNGAESGGVVTWQHSDLTLPAPNTSVLAPTESTQVTVTVRVKDEADLGAASSITNHVEVTDSATNTTDNDDDTDTLARKNVKTLLETNHPGTTDPIVTIGEILTYRISLTVPAGVTMTNVKAVDNLDHGLAFVDCAENNPPTDGKHDLVVSSASLTSSEFTFTDDGAGNLTAACNHGTGANNPVITTPPAASDPDAGRELTLNLGTIANADTANEQTIEMTYRVVVLDIKDNVGGKDNLNNLVKWTWDGGELEGEANPVEIVEPEMDIEKSTEVSVAPLGATIPFTIEIYQADISSADSYDVVVTDTLPDALEYVPGSVSHGDPIDYDSFDYDSVTHTLTFTWDHFPLLDGAEKARTTITFDATFVGPAPVTNEASIKWTSLPIDPELPDGSVNPDYIQSDYNDNSTERWYDPTDAQGVDDYGHSSSIQIDVPRLPSTGFAPSRITPLPKQDAANAYDQLGQMWLEVPNLGIELPIVGVPLNNIGWDLTWLGGQAGYLEGTAYPGMPGNTAITGHVYLPNGAPGPFVDLHTLQWGDEIILHANGQRYIYQVRTRRKVWPNDLSVLKHEDYDWLTLLTCQGYNERDNTYDYRIAVKAVLIDTEPEK